MSEESRRLVDCLTQLRLTSFRERHAEEAERAAQESWPYSRYLLSLCQTELAEREQRRVARLLAASKLPREKTLASLDRSRLPSGADRQLSSLAQGDFLCRRENVLVFGNPGSGKSHLVCALGHELVQRSWPVLFTTGSLLVQRLLRAKMDLELEEELRRLDKFTALIIDDLGYVQQSREEMEVLFTLLAHRYESRSVLLTSNLVFSQWDRIFKDAMTTAAAVDRLVHHSVILELNIPSYRMESAQKRQTRSKGQDG